jgi:hypothetical protein
MPFKPCHNILKTLRFSGMNKLVLRSIVTILMLLSMSISVWGFSEARLVTLSKSGQTAVFNIGVHDGVKEGEYGVMVKEINALDKQKLRLIPVARARNVKINADTSIWILYRVYDAGLLSKDDKYLFFTESNVMNGRRDVRVGRMTVIGKDGRAKEAVTNSLRDDKDRLSKLKDKYEEDEMYHDKEFRTDDDVKLLNVDEWRESGKTQYRTAIYKSPYEKEWSREHRLSTFEKMVVAYLKKFNDPNFNYDEFYSKQAKVAFSNELKVHSSYDSEYENFLYRESRRKTAEAKVYRSILEKGRSWSENYSDEELRQVLQEVSVLQESDRRDYVIADPHRYTFYFDYGVHLTDHQTDKDTGYRRSGLYTLQAELEGIPFIRKTDLERFTIFGNVRSSKSAFSANNLNIGLDDLAVALGLNWYPMHAPYAIQSPMIFLGTFVRSGYGTATAPSGGEKGTYTSLVAPGFQGGVRYNFRNGVGMRFTASLETMQLERYGKTLAKPVLPDHTSVTEGKMGFAMAYSF